jgi:hypothetical protein
VFLSAADEVAALPFQKTRTACNKLRRENIFLLFLWFKK